MTIRCFCFCGLYELRSPTTHICAIRLYIPQISKLEHNKLIFSKVPTLRFSNKTIWEKKRIKDFCEVNPKTEELEDEFIYIDLESVSKGCLLSKNIISKTNAPSRAQRVLKNNDILFQCVRPYQMNNLLFNAENADFQYVASTGYAQIRTQENSSFVYQLLHSPKFNKEVMLRCTGSSYPAISSSDLEDIEVYICGVEEQQKIGYFLDLIDRRIAVQNKIIKHRKSLIFSLVIEILLSFLSLIESALSLNVFSFFNNLLKFMWTIFKEVKRLWSQKKT